MEEEPKIEEKTSEKPTEEETVEEETSTEEPGTPEEKPETSKEEVEAQRNRLYKRLKDKERDVETLKKENKELKKAPPVSGNVDIADLAEKMSALSGLDTVERQRAIKESELQQINLGDARKSQEFKDWRVGYRARIDKEKTLEPSTKQSIDKTSSKAQVSRFMAGEMTPEEKSVFLQGLGVTKDYKKFGTTPSGPRPFEKRSDSTKETTPPGV